MVGWIILVVVLLTVTYLALTYNRLVGLSKRADGAWSDIDVQLKRRWDLVPALVETVKGYARHESGTLEAVVDARSRAAGSPDLAGRGESERNLSTAVGRLFALAEAYPELRASENFRGLHKSLVEIEDTVQAARRYYNAVVRDFNTVVQSFPSMFVASAGGFAERAYFQLEGAERGAPQVGFGPPDAGVGATATGTESGRPG